MNHHTSYFGIFIIFLITVSSVSCTGNKEHPGRSEKDLNGIVYAERFTLDKQPDFTRLTIIDPWQGAEGVNHTFYLVQKGVALPAEIDSSLVIRVPVEKIVCMSTTHLAMIMALGKENTIKGVSGGKYIYNKVLFEKFKSGEIPDIGYEGNLNKELILKISPDIILMYGIGSESVSYFNKIRELGIKTLFNADYLENDPLGKAEWIKFFGALYCKESMADSLFNVISEEYNATRSFIEKNSHEKPKIMLGLPYKDTWYVSPGNSYISKLIADAGGDYLWKEAESSYSMPLGIENVYLKAISSDYWLNTGIASTREEISATDRRLSDLSCFRRGNLYNNNKLLNENGGNDYWESGSLNPHLVLKDIASIIHPGLFADYELTYYRKLN